MIRKMLHSDLFLARSEALKQSAGEFASFSSFANAPVTGFAAAPPHASRFAAASSLGSQPSAFGECVQQPQTQSAFGCVSQQSGGFRGFDGQPQQQTTGFSAFGSQQQPSVFGTQQLTQPSAIGTQQSPQPSAFGTPQPNLKFSFSGHRG